MLDELQNYKDQNYRDLHSGTAKQTKLDHVIKEDEDEDKKDISYDLENFRDVNTRLDVKRRMINFKMKVFDKLDLKKIISFWKNNRDRLKKNNKERNTFGRVEITNIPKKDKNEKKKDKTDSNVKYDFKMPDRDIRKIIPFCNNIFTIQKNEG